jgi:hypothetical protein
VSCAGSSIELTDSTELFLARSNLVNQVRWHKRLESLPSGGQIWRLKKVISAKLEHIIDNSLRTTFHIMLFKGRNKSIHSSKS